jgi:DDE superfamily endonuclease
MLQEALKSGRITRVWADGNREFISLLACICADGTTIPPALIYQGSSYDLQSSWLDDLGDDTTYFAASDNGWSCNSLGLQWLEKVFDRHMKEKAKRSRRLLIVDGHSSYVNMAFINLASRLRIIIAILPLHSTHRLQPLNVGLFGPLSIAYSHQLNQLQHSSLGLVSMTKRLFYPLFREAYQEAFTLEHIQHAFAKTGIWPCNSESVIGPIRRPTTEITSPRPNEARTPLTCCITRWTH